jgi:hypothetical protein
LMLADGIRSYISAQRRTSARLLCSSRISLMFIEKHTLPVTPPEGVAERTVFTKP